MAVSIKSLNLKSACETPAKFEPIDDDGKSLGFTLQVIGSHAAKVTKLIAKAVDAKRTAEEMAREKGKKAPVTKVEDDLAFSDELAAIRIVGWEGLEESYSESAALELVSNNPTIKEQIMTFSDTMSNYTKK